MPSDDLIIPDVYDPDVRTAVSWLQEHLPLSDQYLVQLIEASRPILRMEKRGGNAYHLADTNIRESFRGHKWIVVLLRLSP